MNVVAFTNTYAPLVGGLERSVANVHEDLQRLGHFSRVITPEYKGAEESKNGVLRVPAIKGVGEKEFSIALLSSTRMEHWLEAIEPDIVHTHQPFLLGETAWKLAQHRHTPIVFTHHTLYERYAHYLLVDNDRTRRLLINITNHYANRCHAVVAPTESVRRLLLDRGITAPVFVAPTGIDLDLYRSGSRPRGRRNLGLAPEDRVVGHLGRLSQEKNLEFIVQAAAHALRHASNAKLLLVGDGDRLQWARDHLAEVGLADRLVAPGLLSGVDAADAYAAMDVFIFASHTDTQGLVLAEAMAAGVPVMALDAPGARDCITDGRTGWILPNATTAEAFGQALSAALVDEALRRTLAENAAGAAVEFGRQACIKRLLALYEQVKGSYLPAHKPPADVWDQLAEKVDVDWAPAWDKLVTAFRSLTAE